jgi:hypothetical protein
MDSRGDEFRCYSRLGQSAGPQIMVLEDASHIMMLLRPENGEIDRGDSIRPRVLDLKRKM